MISYIKYIHLGALAEGILCTNERYIDQSISCIGSSCTHKCTLLTWHESQVPNWNGANEIAMAIKKSFLVCWYVQSLNGSKTTSSYKVSNGDKTPAKRYSIGGSSPHCSIDSSETHQFFMFTFLNNHVTPSAAWWNHAMNRVWANRRIAYSSAAQYGRLPASLYLQRCLVLSVLIGDSVCKAHYCNSALINNWF